MAETGGADFFRSVGIVTASEGGGSATLLRHVDWAFLAVPVTYVELGIAVAIPEIVPGQLGLDVLGLISDPHTVPAAEAGTWGPQSGNSTMRVRFMVVGFDIVSDGLIAFDEDIQDGLILLTRWEWFPYHRLCARRGSASKKAGFSLQAAAVFRSSSLREKGPPAHLWDEAEDVLEVLQSAGNQSRSPSARAQRSPQSWRLYAPG